MLLCAGLYRQTVSSKHIDVYSVAKVTFESKVDLVSCLENEQLSSGLYFSSRPSEFASVWSITLGQLSMEKCKLQCSVQCV